jgi:hypothetical protein
MNRLTLTRLLDPVKNCNGCRIRVIRQVEAEQFYDLLRSKALSLLILTRRSGTPRREMVQAWTFPVDRGHLPSYTPHLMRGAETLR